jgi:hypothetical protein
MVPAEGSGQQGSGHGRQFQTGDTVSAAGLAGNHRAAIELKRTRLLVNSARLDLARRRLGNCLGKR